MLFHYLMYAIAGLGSGAVAGFASLSTAVVITPILVSICGWQSYDAVTVALAADVLASLLSAATYAKNGNMDRRRGGMLAFAAFFGTVAGSWVGYLFSQAAPDGLGYMSMLTTVGLGLKFTLQPITEGHSAQDGATEVSHSRLVAALACAVPIGFVCGFTGSGGGALMLGVLTLLIGYDLKSAVGTGAMVMTVVALVGTVSHVGLGAAIQPVPMAIVIVTCLVGALLAARYANRCETRKLNHVVGGVLLALGVFTLAIKLLA